MKIPILLVSNEEDFTDELLDEFKQQSSEIEVFLPGQLGAEKAILAACWFPDASILAEYPNIKCIHSLAAGVDHLGSEFFASGLPICRIVDENQRRGMFEYVLWGVLNTHRDLDLARINQMQNNWHRYPQRIASDLRIGVLGLGSLGAYVAKELAKFGYQVFGWSRSVKQIDGVTCLSGHELFSSAIESTILNQLDVVVNLLPLNSATQGILSKPFFDALPQGAYLINCGRGGHVNDSELIQAIETGHLRGALLDVFTEEPLPDSNPLWNTKGISITPHMASAASTSAIVFQVIENSKNLTNGDALKNVVHNSKGY